MLSALTQILLFLCGLPVLDTFVPVVFQRESQVIPAVTTCLPLKRLDTKAFVLCKLFFRQYSPVYGSFKELARFLSLS